MSPVAAITAAIAKPFPNYLELPTRIPVPIWRAMRFAGLLVTLAFFWLLATDPSLGLALFWRLTIPLLPALFAFAPGLWRQVCPMAYLNQLPQRWGISLERTLPVELKNLVYLGSVLVFFVLVSMRQLFFNIDPNSLIALMAIALVLAFLGGIVFKGRSGWCGTFCPLAPIQRAYGNAPVVMIKNGYCPTCVGCQKNCYDFNPKAAIHSDLADSDPWYAGHKKFFVGALPGFVAAFYLAHNPNVVGVVQYYAEFIGAMAVSLGAFAALTGLTRITPYRASAIFAMGALMTYYWFSAPLLVAGVSALTGYAFPHWVQHAVFAEIGVLVAASLYNGIVSERAFVKLSKPTAEPRVGVNTGKLRAAGAAEATDLIVERKSGRSFKADPARSLLEGIESAGLKIDFGCRMGMCGADPIAIIEGAETLSPPGEDEVATLRRLGLEGRARMACVCRAPKGGVVLDLGKNPRDLPAPAPAAPAIDYGEQAGIRRVVIIGNGAAGMTAADEIRRLSPSVHIDVIAKEDHTFYNRMAIGRLLYGRTALDGLYLVTPDWAERKRATLWLNTMATSVDLAKHVVSLGTGEKLSYDKLIMAQGSRAMIPPAPGTDLPGCFVLREAADAMAMRRWRQEKRCERAVVVGGGVLGVEAADALRHLNLEVTILQRGERLMDRELDRKGSEILTRFLEGLGVKVRTGAKIKRVKGAQRVEAVEFEDGEEIPADIYVACAGVAPNSELAKEAGLNVGRGILVDRSMRTSDPDVFAVGDVAELPGERGGLWAVSNAQATVAAAGVFGMSAAYVAPSTLVSLKLEGIDVKGYGVNQPADGQELIADAEEQENTHRRLIVAGGKIAGAVFVGPPGVGRHIGAAIQRDADITPVLDRLRRGEWDALGNVV